MSTDFKLSLNRDDYSVFNPAREVELYGRYALVRAILPGDHFFGYRPSKEEQFDTIVKLFQKSDPLPIKGLINRYRPSLFIRLVFPKTATKNYIAHQSRINQAVQNVLHTQYQTRDITSQLSQLEIGLYYLINAFSDYLTSDLATIKETYSGEAQDFADKINKYYLHFDLNMKSSLVGRQLKACVDNSMQLHTFLKK